MTFIGKEHFNIFFFVFLINFNIIIFFKFGQYLKIKPFITGV